MEKKIFKNQKRKICFYLTFLIISVLAFIFYIVFGFGKIANILPFFYVTGLIIEFFAVIFPLIILSTIFLVNLLLIWLKSLANKKIELDIEILKEIEPDE